MHDISLSAFFPCYNEDLNLESLVLEAIQVLSPLVYEFEILIINDGSTDKTGLIAERLSKQHEFLRVIHHENNRGYGAALISGFSHCVHEWVFFTDGDNQFLVSEIALLLQEVDDHDLIIGYRKERKDPWHRILYGRAWTRFVQLLFGLKFRDINCAFKLIRRSTIDGLTLHASGAVINTELLVKTTLGGARIKQLAVSHRPRMFGKQTGGNLSVIFIAFMELFRLWRELERREMGF
jgi:glycosyltransferase involved in cell wall biosynthesis